MAPVGGGLVKKVHWDKELHRFVGMRWEHKRIAVRTPKVPKQVPGQIELL